MKKLTLVVLILFFLVSISQAQNIAISKLIKYISTPIPDIAEELLSSSSWKLLRSENVDSTSIVTMDNGTSTLSIRQYKDYKNVILYAFNDKKRYDVFKAYVISLNPTKLSSKVEKNGSIISVYWGQKYGYELIIHSKSLYAIKIYDKVDYLIEGFLTEKN